MEGIVDFSTKTARTQLIIEEIKKFPNFKKIENGNRVVITECETYSFDRTEFRLKLSVSSLDNYCAIAAVSNTKLPNLRGLIIDRHFVNSERNLISGFVKTLQDKFLLKRVSTGEEDTHMVYVFTLKD